MLTTCPSHGHVACMDWVVRGGIQWTPSPKYIQTSFLFHAHSALALVGPWLLINGSCPMVASNESFGDPIFYWYLCMQKSSTFGDTTLQHCRSQRYQHGVRGICWTTCRAVENPHGTTTWSMLGLSTIFANWCGDGIGGSNIITSSYRQWCGGGLEGELRKCKLDHKHEIVGLHGAREWGPWSKGLDWGVD